MFSLMRRVHPGNGRFALAVVGMDVADAGLK